MKRQFKFLRVIIRYFLLKILINHFGVNMTTHANIMKKICVKYYYQIEKDLLELLQKMSVKHKKNYMKKEYEMLKKKLKMKLI